MLGLTIPTDELIFFRGVGISPTGYDGQPGMLANSISAYLPGVSLSHRAAVLLQHLQRAHLSADAAVHEEIVGLKPI